MRLEPNMSMSHTFLMVGLIALAAVAFIYGTSLGGIILFILAGAVVLMIVYAVLFRIYRFMLYGTLSGSDSSSSGGDQI